MNTTYLVHHGVKGMKWGVRRYRNKDGSLTNAGRKRYGSGLGPGYSDLTGYKYQRVGGRTRDYKLKAGKGKMYRLSVVQDEKDFSKGSDRTYVNVNKRDAQVYRQFYPASLQKGMINRGKVGFTFEQHLTAKKDLNIAGGKTVLRQFAKMYGDHTLRDYYKQSPMTLLPDGTVANTRDWYKKDPKAFDNWYNNKRDIFETFGVGLQSEQLNGKLNKQFRDELRKQGYQGMADIYSTSNRETKKATIIFDPNESLEKKGRSKVVVDTRYMQDAENALKRMSKDPKQAGDADKQLRTARSAMFYNPDARAPRTKPSDVVRMVAYGGLGGATSGAATTGLSPVGAAVGGVMGAIAGGTAAAASSRKQQNIRNKAMTSEEFAKRYPNVAKVYNSRNG